jgi:VIT1/CCC1 family predicted Fe2+/Mn2+ transporter
MKHMVQILAWTLASLTLWIGGIAIVAVFAFGHLALAALATIVWVSAMTVILQRLVPTGYRVRFGMKRPKA